MPAKNPRIHVTLTPSDTQIIQILAEKNNTSLSSVCKKLIEDGLEEYEDYLLAKRADEAEKEWIQGGRKTISHEELWKKINSL